MVVMVVTIVVLGPPAQWSRRSVQGGRPWSGGHPASRARPERTPRRSPLHIAMAIIMVAIAIIVVVIVLDHVILYYSTIVLSLSLYIYILEIREHLEGLLQRLAPDGAIYIYI